MSFETVWRFRRSHCRLLGGAFHLSNESGRSRSHLTDDTPSLPDDAWEAFWAEDDQGKSA
jgi:hypothetical protein